MSLYHIIFLALVVGAVWEHIKKKTPTKLFVALFAILAIVLCIRFGQGQDYFNYARIYYLLPRNPITAIADRNIHTELGWKVICCAFKIVRMPFPAMVFAVSGYMLILFYRFLRLYGGERKILALVLCYHTLYMTYFLSVLRQGVVIATFLGLLLPWLQQKKYIRYSILVLLLSTIHSVALVLLVLPLLGKVQLSIKQMAGLVVISFVMGFVLHLVNVGAVLNQIKPHIYFSGAELSKFAVAERAVTFVVVTVCYYLSLEGKKPDQEDSLLGVYKIYAAGIALYGMLMWSALIASRTVYILKVVEVILLCASITKSKKVGTVALCYCLLLSAVMYVKNIDSYLTQGQYQNATVIDYPFVTVFNKEDILNYRIDAQDYPFQ